MTKRKEFYEEVGKDEVENLRFGLKGILTCGGDMVPLINALLEKSIGCQFKYLNDNTIPSSLPVVDLCHYDADDFYMFINKDGEIYTTDDIEGIVEYYLDEMMEVVMDAVDIAYSVSVDECHTFYGNKANFYDFMDCFFEEFDYEIPLWYHHDAVDLAIEGIIRERMEIVDYTEDREPIVSLCYC